MKFKTKLLALFAMLVPILLACGKQEGPAAKKEDAQEKLNVVVTNSILYDMVKNVAHPEGQEPTDDNIVVNLHSMVPVGQDPHEYDPLPEDIKACSNAQVIFYNGLNLETGGNAWFKSLMEVAKKKENEDYFVVSKGVKALHLTTAGKEDEEDPHAWLDLQNGIKYVNNIAEVLAKKDPANAELYKKNAAAYTKQLAELDQEAKSKFNSIPEDKKLIVTSEGAFKYFSNAYNVPAAYIWEINTEEEGTPEQLKQVIQKIKESNVQCLFVETSVDSRPMETVSKETGLSIYDKIYTDSIDKPGEKGDSYYNMVKWNLDTIHDGLNQ